MKKSNDIKIPIPVINPVGIYYNISRIYEIVKLGNFSVSCSYYKGIEPDSERDVNPKDIGTICEFFGFNSIEGGDLIIEVTKPQPDEIFSTRRCETLADCDLRIETARKNPLPDSYNSEACIHLFKTAYIRLGFGLTDYTIVWKIAAVIAQLGASETIRVEHIAEAIQYRLIQRTETTKFFIS